MGKKEEEEEDGGVNGWVDILVLTWPAEID